jgi:hypothetical protein
VIASVALAAIAMAAPSPPDAAAASGCRTAGLHLSHFHAVGTANGRVRIWWLRSRPHDAKRARAYRKEIDGHIWPSFVHLLGRGHQPLSDAHTGCPHGGDGRLDIYIVHGAFRGLTDGRVGLALPYPADEVCQTHAPVFVAIRPQMSRSVLAHELFHAFQASYTRLSSCIDYTEWDEATATWAQDHVYPHDQDEHRFKGAFAYPDSPLALADPYSAWAFLQAVTKTQSSGPAIVAKILRLEESVPPREHDASNIVDRALPGGFAKRFPDFALRGWNQKPIPTGKVNRAFAQWDAWHIVPMIGSGRGLKPTPVTKVDLKGKALRKDKLERGSSTLRVLSREYYHFDFTDPKVRFVAVTDPGKTHFRGSPGAGVQAFVRIGDKWRVEDWSDGRDVSFCRDRKDENVTELVVVMSNSSFANKIKGATRPVLESSNFCEATFRVSAFREVQTAVGARGTSTADQKFVPGVQKLTTLTRDPAAATADPNAVFCDPTAPCTFNLAAKETNEGTGHVTRAVPSCSFTYPDETVGPFEPDVIFATLDLSAATPAATFETQPGLFEVGDISNDACGAHSSARVDDPFRKVIPLDTLVSGRPVTVAFTGSGTKPTEPFSAETSIGWQWTYTLTFARVKKDGSRYP